MGERMSENQDLAEMAPAMLKEPVTGETLKARAALSGIALDETKLEELAETMERALSQLRSLDLRAMRMVEPALIFEARWNE